MKLSCFRLRGYNPLGRSFPTASPNKIIFDFTRKDIHILQPPKIKYSWVWASPFSLAATCGMLDLVSIPLGTEMFHFPRFASVTTYVYQISEVCSERFPHSEISG